MPGYSDNPRSSLPKSYVRHIHKGVVVAFVLTSYKYQQTKCPTKTQWRAYEKLQRILDLCTVACLLFFHADINPGYSNSSKYYLSVAFHASSINLFSISCHFLGALIWLSSLNKNTRCMLLYLPNN